MCEIKRQLAIVKLRGKYISAVLEGNALDHVIVDEGEDNSPRIGDIYMGKVSRVVTNINAAFVEIRKGMMCYLALKESSGKGLKQGQEIPVQLTKAAVKTKQAVVSQKLEFAGKYAVVTSRNLSKSISGKIRGDAVRSHLKELLGEVEDIPFGIILRTSCEAAADAEILAECRKLARQAEEVLEAAGTRSPFSCIYRADSELVRFMRGRKGEPFDRIITDERAIYELLTGQEEFAGENIVWYEDPSYPLCKLLGIEAKLEKALAKHVWLKSGASLVIEPTEALTVIDVNTEKAVMGKRNSETTFFKVNMEAAREAARQIRVRGLSGIILIDFIDMKEKEHVEELLRELDLEFRKDDVRTTIVDITKLGLVEITRMKLRRPLMDVLKNQGDGKK